MRTLWEAVEPRDRLALGFAQAVVGLIDSAGESEWLAPLGELGLAAEVDQLFLFKNDARQASNREAVVAARWLRDVGDPKEPIRRIHWTPFVYDHLSRGDVVRVRRDELPEPDRTVAETMGVASFLVAPVDAGPQWWGALAFATTEEERRWNDDEVFWLRMTCRVLGGMLRRGDLHDQIVGALSARGLARGHWLVDIERARVAIDDADTLLRRLRDAFVQHPRD